MFFFVNFSKKTSDMTPRQNSWHQKCWDQSDFFCELLSFKWTINVNVNRFSRNMFSKNVVYDVTLNNDDVTTPFKMSESLRFFCKSVLLHLITVTTVKFYLLGPCFLAIRHFVGFWPTISLVSGAKITKKSGIKRVKVALWCRIRG